MVVERRRVRFDCEPTIILPSPEIDEKPNDAAGAILVLPLHRRCRRLSPSITFPMSDTRSTDFNADFVPQTTAAQTTQPSTRTTKFVKPTVRRMSLKEFTGLETVASTLSERCVRGVDFEATATITSVFSERSTIVPRRRRLQAAIAPSRRRRHSRIARLSTSIISRHAAARPALSIVRQLRP